MSGDFHQRIRVLRREAGLTQEQLAATVRVTSGNIIAQWENGRNEPSTRHLIALADTFGVSLDVLLRGREHK